MESIIDTLGKIDLGTDHGLGSEAQCNEPIIPHANILYYELVFDPDQYKQILNLVLSKTKNDGLYKPGFTSEFTSQFTTEIQQLVKNPKPDEQILIAGLNPYKLNDEFHITVLYTGGKPDERGTELHKYLGNKYPVLITKIGMTENFIALGVEIQGGLPYYGNEHVHITIGLNKYTQTKTKSKVLPKDSYTSLLAPSVILLAKDEQLRVESTFALHKKN